MKSLNGDPSSGTENVTHRDKPASAASHIVDLPTTTQRSEDIDFKDLEPPVTIIYLFSGPDEEKEGSFKDECAKLNAKVLMRDTLIDPEKHDVLDPDVWRDTSREVKESDGALLSPPCGSFSAGRNNDDGGPRPLRGAHGAERYGLRDLDQNEKEQVRVGTGCIVRTAEAAQLLLDQGPVHDDDGEVWIPWVIEQPLPRPDRPSGLKLDEVLQLDEHDAVSDSNIAQCPLGAESVKHTALKGTVTIESPFECPHEKRWWRTPWSGEWHWGGHPPLKGKQRAIKAEDWRPSMKQRWPPKGEYLTKGAAAYPSRMNRLLAQKIVSQARRYKRAKMRSMQMCETTTKAPSTPPARPSMKRAAAPTPPRVVRFAMRDGATSAGAQGDGPDRQLQPLKKCGRWGNVLVTEPYQEHECASSTHWNESAIGKRITFELDLKGGKTSQEKATAEQVRLVVGDARNTADSVSKLSAVKKCGTALRQSIDKWFDELPKLEEQCLALLGLDDDPLTTALADAAGNFHSFYSKFCDFFNADPEVKPSEEFPTEIKAHLLRAWANEAHEPAAHTVDWLDRTGTPAGLSTHFNLKGLWPDVPPGKEDDPSLDIETDFESFANYEGFDTDDDAFKELMGFVAQSKLRAYPSLAACKRDLGHEPVLSRFGLIVKTKNGKTKRRIILDCKQSGLSKKTARRFRVILPRLTDAVRDVLILMANMMTDEQAEEFIIDFSDAFWNMPIAREERRWFAGRVRGIILVYQDTPQGSRNAPLSWCTLSAMLMRLTQSLFCSRREARIQIYVDDPATAIVGTVKQRNRIVAIIIAVWHSLGFGLAYAKAKRGPSVTWIGGTMKIERHQVTVQIPPEKISDLFDMIKKISKDNVVPVKLLRQFTGKASSLASLIDVLRPFITDLYGALYADPQQINSKAPPGCVWRKQIEVAIDWLKAFLGNKSGPIKRIYSLSSFTGTGTVVRRDWMPHHGA